VLLNGAYRASARARALCRIFYHRSKSAVLLVNLRAYVIYLARIPFVGSFVKHRSARLRQRKREKERKKERERERERERKRYFCYTSFQVATVRRVGESNRSLAGLRAKSDCNYSDPHLPRTLPPPPQSDTHPRPNSDCRGAESTETATFGFC